MADIARDLGLRVNAVKGRAPRDATRIGRARVAVYRSWTDNIDEGWTRWLLDTYGFTYTSVRDADVRAGKLRSRFDAIIVPSASVDRLVNGNAAGSVPAEYAGGLGDEGLAALRAFVEEGGTLICLDQAGELAIRTFDLPVRDVASAAGDRFYCPGSILRLELDPSQPLAYGMDPRTAAFFSFSSAYAMTGASAAAEGGAGSGGPAVETIARYGKEDVLLSGYLEGEDVIADQSAVVQARVGGGRVLLFGFPPQHRGQAHATFRLLFNAILTSPDADAPAPQTRR